MRCNSLPHLRQAASLGDCTVAAYQFYRHATPQCSVKGNPDLAFTALSEQRPTRQLRYRSQHLAGRSGCLAADEAKTETPPNHGRSAGTKSVRRIPGPAGHV